MEIVLVRHGQPTQCHHNKMSASGFSQWVRHYNQASIGSKSLPPQALLNKTKGYFVVSSHLKRAMHSAELCFNAPVDLVLPELREMDIPRFKLPFTLTANTWLILNRLLWLANVNGRVESFPLGKQRAKLVATKLINLAERHQQVAVFGHGLMNKYIAKELLKLGWRGSYQRPSYWGFSQFYLT